jgi:hypothetical protein
MTKGGDNTKQIKPMYDSEINARMHARPLDFSLTIQQTALGFYCSQKFMAW